MKRSVYSQKYWAKATGRMTIFAIALAASLDRRQHVSGFVRISTGIPGKLVENCTDKPARQLSDNTNCPIPGVTIEKYKDNANCETIDYI